MKDFFKKNTIPFIMGVITSLIGTYIYSYFQPDRIIISYEITQPLDIGKGLSSIFPSFELRHNENTINDGVVQYIHGRFKNTSEKDVKTTATNRQIELILNDSCQVMDVNVPDKYEYEVKAISSNNKIIIYMPETLKPDEEVEFSAIINNHNDADPLIDINTRIQDVSLKQINYELKKEKSHDVILFNELDIMTLLLLILTNFILFYFLIERKERQRKDK